MLRTSPPRVARAIGDPPSKSRPDARPPGRGPTVDGHLEGRRMAAAASPGQGRVLHERQSIRISFPLSGKKKASKLTIGKSLKYGCSVVAFSLPGSHSRTAQALSGPGKQPSPSRRFTECRSDNCGNLQDKFCVLVHHSVFPGFIVFRKYLAPIGPEFREN